MGMAASQARYLALVARKSNCEYEGQQINQARTALANQSANLFNQMLGLSVPIPPSTQDFTKTQYSFTDGINGTVIDKWEQLGNQDSDYNYIVNYHYNADVYTGEEKKMNDPQVQFSLYTPVDTSATYATSVRDIWEALNEVNTAQEEYDDANAKLASLQSQASKLNTYKDVNTYTGLTAADVTYTPGTDTYTVDGTNFTRYDEATASDALKARVKFLVDSKALTDADKLKLYVGADDSFAFSYDLEALPRTDGGGSTPILPIYQFDDIDEMQNKINDQILDVMNKYEVLISKQTEYSQLNVPAYVGNSELTPLRELTDDQMTEILQIIRDTGGETSDMAKCFSGTNYTTATYSGGIYSFELNGKTYYTTYYDLDAVAQSGQGYNNVDNQDKLNYFRADYVNQRIENTSKALLETDSQGRFCTIRFEDDSVTYTLNYEQITDDAAYNDAMNKYYYENAKYDKMVQDINAKTSIIQQEDRTLELRLKQLDTEQLALKTEIDAVQGIVKDNVEKSFKTFGG